MAVSILFEARQEQQEEGDGYGSSKLWRGGCNFMILSQIKVSGRRDEYDSNY